MKKYGIYIYVLIVCLSGCRHMDEFQINPNQPTVGTPETFLTGVEQELFSGILAYETISAASRYLIGFSSHSEEYQYYRWAYGSFGRYSSIRNIMEMERSANENSNYLAIAKLFKSIFFYELTMRFGDIPYSQSMQLVEGIDKPKYDSQKDVFIGILKELEEANSMFSLRDNSISGDFIFNGDILKWKKFNNSFKLRVLLSLSHYENDTDLNIKSVFSEMMNNPAEYPVFTGNEDNGQRIGNTIAPHPFFSDQGFISYIGLEKDFADALKTRNDPRLKFYAEMTADAKERRLSVDDMNAYDGLPGSASNDENTQNMLKASIPSMNYYTKESYEPVLYMGYYEVNFLIAEAIFRNWWKEENAEEYYKKGIKASMDYWNISETEINEYLAQDNVKFNSEAALEMILIQKYLASYLNSGWEAFYTQRRTGIPIFDVSGDG
ncbi:MAG: SusD/RagB family nutrient-binding outer membrane lipoprotein, partial [Tannerella sp.]|nr:SusD/RagB family nutrient-binding outer membrane lipoprotein [Tannerella sp.]